MSGDGDRPEVAVMGREHPADTKGGAAAGEGCPGEHQPRASGIFCPSRAG